MLKASWKALLTVAMLLPVAGLADVYIAIPSDTSQALYFPNADTAHCYSVVVNSAPVMVKTNRCWLVLLPSVFIEGHLLLMNRPIEQLLKSCESLNCELRAMPND